MSTTNISIGQDKFGKYHSCDRETYKKLRKVRFFKHVERIQKTRHDRWSRKLPHNRLRWIFKGVYKSLLTDKGVAMPIWESVLWEEPELCPINLSILDGEYRNAKIGHDDQNKVFKMKLDETGIDLMIAQLYEWTDRCYGKRF